MLMPPSHAGRTQPVRLTEVPLTLRRRAGRRLMDAAADDGDLVLSLQLKRAIESPSETIYWLPAEAVERVLT